MTVIILDWSLKTPHRIPVGERYITFTQPERLRRLAADGFCDLLAKLLPKLSLEEIDRVLIDLADSQWDRFLPVIIAEIKRRLPVALERAAFTRRNVYSDRGSENSTTIKLTAV